MSQTDAPCPFCHSTDLTRNEWYVDDEEVPAVECNNCKAGAPLDAWNRSRWLCPENGDPLPPEDARILQTYRQEDGTESDCVISTWREAMIEHWRPLVRWMPIPSIN